MFNEAQLSAMGQILIMLGYGLLLVAISLLILFGVWLREQWAISEPMRYSMRRAHAYRKEQLAMMKKFRKTLAR